MIRNLFKNFYKMYIILLLIDLLGFLFCLMCFDYCDRFIVVVLFVN